MATSVVTGGCGFVGGRLVEALLGRGDDVVSVDLEHRIEHPGARFVAADLRDADAVSKAIEGADTVFHCASMVHTKWNMVDLLRTVNVDGTRNVIDACLEHGVPKLVYMSSASVVYEGHDIENGDETLPYAAHFQAPYAQTKAEAEQMVLRANCPTLATTALRPHSVFGPGDTRLAPAVVEKARAGRLRAKVGWGSWLTDFTYVDNIVDACLLAEAALPGPAAGEAYFITNGEPTDFWAFVADLVEGLGYSAPTRAVPGPLAYAAAWGAEMADTLRGGTLDNASGLSRFTVRYLCTHHYYRVDKAGRDLGYHPAVSVSEGIERTVSWLADRGYAAQAAS